MTKTVELGGATLRCIEELPAGDFLDMAAAIDTNLYIKQWAAYSRFLRRVVLEEDAQILEEVLYRKENVVSYADVDTAVGKLLLEYSQRPTKRPSESLPGTEPIKQPSRVVSLSPVTVKTEEKSPQDGALVAS